MTLASTAGDGAGLGVPIGYAAVRELGRGGMGVVWLATELATGRAVVIKRLLAAGDLELEARFQREAEALAALRHPAILSILTTGRDAAGPFLVLEYVAGESLDQDLARGPLPIDEVITILGELAAALTACHAAGIAHRDLKPANLLRKPTDDGSPRIVVADFGLAGFADAEQRLTMTGQQLGTPEFMAPEQVEGRRVGPAADIWGWAATGHALLTGQPPLRGGLVELQARLVRGEPVASVRSLRPDTPPWLAELLSEAFALAPGQRPSAAELGAAIRSSRATGRRRQRRLARALKGALALVAILAIAVVAGLAWRRRPARFELSTELGKTAVTRAGRFRLRGRFIGGGSGLVVVQPASGPELSCPVPANGRWKTSVELAEGPNAFVITARDARGRRAGPFKITITRDTAAPTVTLEPMESFARPRVLGQLSEDGVKVTLDGRAVPVNGRRIDVALELTSAAAPHRLVLEDPAGNSRVVSIPRHYILGETGDTRGEAPAFPTLAAIPAIRKGLPARVQIRPGRWTGAATITAPLELRGDPGAVLVANERAPVMELLESATVTIRALRIEQPHSAGPAAIRHRGQRLDMESCEGFSAACDFLVIDSKAPDAAPVTRLRDCVLERAGFFMIRQSCGTLELDRVRLSDRGSRVEFSESLDRAKRSRHVRLEESVREEYGEVLIYERAVASIRDMRVRNYESPALTVRDRATARVTGLSVEGWVNKADGETESSGVRVSRGGRLELRDAHITAGHYALVVNAATLRAVDSTFVALGSAVLVGEGHAHLTRCVLAGRPDITDDSGWRFAGEIHGPALGFGTKNVRVRLDRVRIVNLRGESCRQFDSGTSERESSKPLITVFTAPRRVASWSGRRPKGAPEAEAVLSVRDSEIDADSRSLARPSKASDAPAKERDASGR